MNYSSAIFRDYNEDLRDDNSQTLETLEEGQIRKMKYAWLKIYKFSFAK